MECLSPDWKNIPDNVGALTTLRRGGCSLAPYDDGDGGGGLNFGIHVGDLPQHVQNNRQLLRGLLPAEPTWLNQVHGVTVCDTADAQGMPQADACVATQRGAVCVVMTADCLPVLFCDMAGKVVAAAHAGWRGLVGGVVENTLTAMRERGADDIAVWLGPAIGPQRFEVGNDVRQAFVGRDMYSHAAFVPIAGREGKYLADIYALARIRLANAGVQRIYGGGLCTVSDVGRFYSYRRDKITGRMASLIWLK